MKAEQEQLNAMYERVQKVFPETLLDTLASQQENSINNAIDRVLKKEGPEALTIPRLEGIKKMVLNDLFPTDFAQALKDLKG